MGGGEFGGVWQLSACWGSVSGSINFPLSTVSTSLDELWSQFLEYTALVSGDRRPRPRQQTPKENLQPSLSPHILGQTPRCSCQTELNTNQLIFAGRRRSAAPLREAVNSLDAFWWIRYLRNARSGLLLDRFRGKRLKWKVKLLIGWTGCDEWGRSVRVLWFKWVLTCILMKCKVMLAYRSSRKWFLWINWTEDAVLKINKLPLNSDTFAGRRRSAGRWACVSSCLLK